MAADGTLVTPDEARYLILQGTAPAGMVVDGDLEFNGTRRLSHRPGERHDAERPVARLPHGLRVRRLYINAHPELRSLPRGLCCDELVIWDSGISRVPASVRVAKTLVIGRCPLKYLPRNLASAPLDLLRLQSMDLRELPIGLRVAGVLDVSHCARLRALPAGLRVTELDASGCTRLTRLPDDLQVLGVLDVRSCVRLEHLPSGLSMRELNAFGCASLRELPADTRVSDELILTNCIRLASLPDGLQTRAIYLNGCTSLRALPEGLRVQELYLAGCTTLRKWPRDGLPASLRRLDISGCTGLADWPATGPTVMKRLAMRGCAGLRSLPPWLRQVDELDVGDCPNLRELPERLRVPGWIDIAGTPLRSLPPSARGFCLRWRGVAISGRVVFHPRTLRASDVLKEPNAEIRRVMLERMGTERFVAEARPVVLDEDHDAGGLRQLLQVEIPDDEPLVCLSVRDPSTGRQYLLRVPPTIGRCDEAAAWIAGFDDPDDYRPVAET